MTKEFAGDSETEDGDLDLVDGNRRKGSESIMYLLAYNPCVMVSAS